MPHKRAKASARAARAAAQGHDLPPSASDSLLSQSKKWKGKGKARQHDAKDAATGGMSKNVWRILNAEKLRAEHQARKKATRDAEDGGLDDGLGQTEVLSGKGRPGKGKTAATGSETTGAQEELRIRPGEKLGDFNRRVESQMRPAMSTALKTARRTKHPKKPLPPATDDEADEPSSSKHPSGIDPHASTRPSRATEFAPRPTSFALHLHDVAMEPPAIRFGAKASSSEPKFATKAKRKRIRGGDGEEGEGEGRMGVSRAQKRVLEEEREKVIQRYRSLKSSTRPDLTS